MKAEGWGQPLMKNLIMADWDLLLRQAACCCAAQCDAKMPIFHCQAEERAGE